MTWGIDGLTGNTRHRRVWFGKLVLQVEVSGRPYCSEGGGSYGPETTWWRDATVSDITMGLANAEEAR